MSSPLVDLAAALYTAATETETAARSGDTSLLVPAVQAAGTG